MTIVTIVIVARGGSSTVAVMIVPRKPFIATSISHALVSLWSTIVLISCDMSARTAVAMAAGFRPATSRSATSTGTVATTTFCDERQ
jgi:hypothetical protein